MTTGIANEIAKIVQTVNPRLTFTITFTTETIDPREPGDGAAGMNSSRSTSAAFKGIGWLLSSLLFSLGLVMLFPFVSAIFLYPELFTGTGSPVMPILRVMPVAMTIGGEIARNALKRRTG